MDRTKRNSVFLTTIALLSQGGLPIAAEALDGGTTRVDSFSGWKAFEIISQNDDPGSDGFIYSMPGNFDGAGAWLVDPATLRIQLSHETNDASISEVDIGLDQLQIAVASMITSGNTGGGSFVVSARQAYDRWSSDGGESWTNTSSNANTNFSRFCSAQAYSAHTFGFNYGFVDEIYITGEESNGGRLFGLDSLNRDLYQLSGTAGSASGGTGGIPFDNWENAALLDTGETDHVGLLLSPDGGSQTMQLYIGEKGKDSTGSASNSFLARNGLAYGSWYYLNAAYPSLGNSQNGTFDTTSSGALSSDKLEDIDTSPSDPTQVVLGDQTSGVFTFDFAFVFNGDFDSGASSFTITMISTTSGGIGSLDNPDNVDWTDAKDLQGVAYPDGLIFVNEDNSSGEIWQMQPDGSSKIKIAGTTLETESSGIFDVSAMLGYQPASVLVTNSQGTPSSMSVLISPNSQMANGTPVPALAPMTRTLVPLLLIVGGHLLLSSSRKQAVDPKRGPRT